MKPNRVLFSDTKTRKCFTSLFIIIFIFIVVVVVRKSTWSQCQKERRSARCRVSCRELKAWSFSSETALHHQWKIILLLRGAHRGEWVRWMWQVGLITWVLIAFFFSLSFLIHFVYKTNKKKITFLDIELKTLLTAEREFRAF